MDGRNTQEVEKRALLDRSEYNKVSRRLNELGAAYEGIISIKDTYFCEKDVKSFSEIEMNEVGSFSLRLRMQAEENKPEEAMLNVKVITRRNDHNSWEEHETKVENAQESAEILKAAGFKSFCIIKKKRSAYTIDGVSIALEDIEDFGLGVEAEIMVSKEKENKAKARIDRVLSSIGVGKGKIVEKSITNIIMREMAKF